MTQLKFHYRALFAIHTKLVGISVWPCQQSRKIFRSSMY